MKKILSFCMLVLFVFTSSWAIASPVDELQTFYQKKDSNLAKSIIQDISDKQLLEKNPDAYAGVFGFVAGLLIENPQYADQFKKMNLSDYTRKTIENASKSISYTKGNIDKYANPTEIWEPANLDGLWGIFFATGSEKIPEAIRIFIEKQKETMPKNEINMTVMAAEWSLEANARQHPIVKKSFDKLKR